MPQSPSSAPSPLTSKSEYYSSLPWFRRCLAMLNWRPVVDYELREIEFDQREIEYKRRMQQLQKESEQLKIEDEQRSIAHEQKMRQLDELDSKLDALLCSSSTSSTPPLSTPDNSKA
jgi:hypothetical protein